MKSTTKRWLLPILTILLTVCLAIGVAACNKGGGKNDDDNVDTGDTLAAPEIELDDETGIITWEAVENADRYIVYEDGVQATTTSDTQYNIKQNQTVEGTYEYTVASYNLSTRETSAKSNAVTYTVKKGGVVDHEHDWEYTEMGEQHLKTCTVCSESTLEDHVYDDDRDNECNKCGHVRSHQHSFTYEQVDENGHNKTCTTCDDIKDEYEAHVYDNPADEECNYCEYKRTVTTPDKYVTLGVGDVETVIPATGASLYVTFGNDVRADKTYVLEFISDTYGAFYQTNIEVKLGSTPIATFTNGVSDPDKIVLDGFELSQSLVITQEGDEEIEVTLTLAEQVKTGEYTLEKDGEMLTIDVGAGVASLNVAFGNWVTNGKKYDLEFSSIVGDHDLYFTLYLEYYEGGTLKTAEYDPDETKTMTITADTSHGLRVSFKTDGIVQSVSLKLTTFVEKPAVPGETKNNPIIKNTVAGIHSAPADLQEAYFRLPAIEQDDKYKITFADTEGVEVKIVNGSDEIAVWSGDILNRDKLGAKPASTYNYILVTAPEGVLCSFTLELFEEAETYDLRADGSATYAELGIDPNKAAQFNLINVDSGDYTLYIGTQSGLSFSVTVGSRRYTVSEGDYNGGTYKKAITIGSETSISIYVTAGLEGENSIGNVQVSLTEPENTSPLEIDKEYKTIFRGGLYDSNMSFEIALKDVPKDSYLITFSFTSYVSTVFVVTPDRGAAGEVGSTTRYQQAQGKIVIDEGCTKITVSLKADQQPGFIFPVTILLEVNPEKTPVLGVNESVEVSIPYATAGNTTAARVEFAPDVKGAPTQYKLSVSVPNDSGNLSIFAYHSEAELTGANGSVWLQYNAASGKYETRSFINTSGYVYLKQISGSNPVDAPNAIVSLSEPGLGIGDTIDSADISQVQIGSYTSSTVFSVTLDGDIEDGTELILTVSPYSGRYTTMTLYVTTDGNKPTSSSKTYSANASGNYIIEFEKSGNVIYLGTNSTNVYCHAYLSLAAKGGGDVGGNDDYSSEGVILEWNETVALGGGDGGCTVTLLLATAISSGSEIGSSIPAGTYTFKFKTSFTFSYANGSVSPAGGTPVAFSDKSGNDNEVTVTIPKGCTTITFRITESNGYGSSVSFSFYLLGEGATIGGDEGGGELVGGGTSYYLFGSTSIGGWGSPVEFDVSSLAYGEYRIYIAFAGTLYDSSQPVFVTCNSVQDDFADLQAHAGWTSGLIINGPTLYIYGFANVGQDISIEIEK